MQTGTLTGTYQSLDGTPAKGNVSIASNPAVVKDPTGNVIFSSPTVLTLDANGFFTVTLPATDDATLDPTGFTYTVTSTLNNRHIRSVTLDLAGGVTRDMADVLPVDPAEPAYAAPVSSVDGRTGAVVLSDLYETARVYNVRDYGATGDGVTDDTATVQAAVTACYATGGTVYFPKGTYRVQPGCISPVFDAAAVQPTKPIKLLGAGPDWRTTTGAGGTPSGASVLDFQGTALGQGVACIELFGTGYFEAEGLHFWQNGTAHTLPYIYSTLTTLMIHNCAFQGHPTKSGTGCDQDAILLGAVAPPDTIASTHDSRFQGYGTVIQNNLFQRIRRAVWGRRASNAVIVRDNTVWSTCGSNGGSAAASGAAIEFQGVSASSTVGVVVAHNLIEMTKYYYGIRMGDYCANNSLIGNNFYDPGAQTTAYVRIEANGGQRHVIVAGYHPDTVTHVSDASAGPSTILNHHQGQRSVLGNPVDVLGADGVTADEGDFGTVLAGNAATNRVKIHRDTTTGIVEADGTNTNVNLQLRGKGSGLVILHGGTGAITQVGDGTSASTTLRSRAVAGGTIYNEWMRGSTIEWLDYLLAGSSNRYWRDAVNAKMHITLTPGAGTGGGLTDINSKLTVQGPVRAQTATTAGRPTASSAGAGAQIYDTTLSKPIWSDGTNWRDAAGTIV